MFNDVLSLDQCLRLVSQLAGTVFPFQCAHGRPSIAPLLSMVDLNSSGRPMVLSNNKRASRKPVKWKGFALQSAQTQA
jgi:DNA mismatch repair protein MLH3